MGAGIIIRHSPLVSRRFGIVAAQVDDLRASAAHIDQAAKAERVDMLIARVPTDDLDRVRDLEGAGFRLMDTLVYFRIDRSSRQPRPDAPDVPFEIRPAGPDAADIVAGIAASAFRDYGGHFHADPRLDDRSADAAYVDWARRLVLETEAGRVVLLAERDRRPLGFLAMNRLGDDGFDIVLNGVDAAAQRQGVYSALLREAIEQAFARGADWLEVSTQITNHAVQRVWTRHGLAPQRSYYTFHKWYEK